MTAKNGNVKNTYIRKENNVILIGNKIITDFWLH